MNSQRLHIRQIRALYGAANPITKRNGRHWYQREHREAREIADETGIRLQYVCACLAILSPRCQWPRVKTFLRALLTGANPRGILDRNVAKATEIIRAQNGIPIDPKSSPKTWAFWQNLWHPRDPRPVTLDSWMLRAHGLPANVRFPQYQALADCYRLVAFELSIIPNQLQATVWLQIKKASNGKERHSND